MTSAASPVTRIRLAIHREEARVKKAQQVAIHRATAAFGLAPDPIGALTTVNQAIERSVLTPQEGAELAYLTTHYNDASLPERIVLYQCLFEISGRDLNGVRPPILT